MAEDYESERVFSGAGPKVLRHSIMPEPIMAMLMMNPESQPVAPTRTTTGIAHWPTVNEKITRAAIDQPRPSG